MINCLKLFLGLILSLLFMGCACMPGGVAASNTPLHAKPYTELGITEGYDSRFAILGIIPVTDGNSLRDAIKHAKGNVGADALINITVDSYTQWWILFSRTVTKVDATGIRFKDEWEGDKAVQR